MVDVEKQDFARILAGELVEYALLPSVGQVLLRLQVLIEKAFFIGDAQKVEDSDDHVEMRKQENLREIGGELLFAGLDACPEFRFGLAQCLGVQLTQARAHLKALVNLISFKFPDGDAAHELMKNIRT